MLILGEQLKEKDGHDEYTWLVVFERAAVKTRRRLSYLDMDTPRTTIEMLPVGSVVAPSRYLTVRATDEDLAGFHLVGHVVRDRGGAWKSLAVYSLGEFKSPRVVAGIRLFEIEGVVNLVTGEMRYQRVMDEPGSPSPEDRVWLVQFLKQYGPWRGKT